jgi:hypothetical protein
MRFLTCGRLTPRPTNNHAVGWYKNDLYSKALAAITYEKYGSTKIIFNRLVFQLLQMDPRLYNYYFVAHAYNDPHSTRLDEPMYSSISGGIGFVGAYTLNSLVHILPESFDFNNR